MSWCLLDCCAYSDDSITYNLEKDFAEELYNYSSQTHSIHSEVYSMNAINSVLVEGFVSLNPIIKDFGDGNSVLHVSVGVPSYYKREGILQQSVSFVPVDFYHPTGSFSLPVKGQELRITGRLRQDRWVSDGQPLSKLKIVAETIEKRS